MSPSWAVRLRRFLTYAFLCSSIGGRRDWSSRFLLAVVLALSVTIVTGFAVDQRNRYGGAIDDAGRAARQYAGILAEHTARSFEGVERALNEAEHVRRLYELGLLGTAQDAREALQRIQRASPVIVSMGWTNAGGDLLINSRDGAQSHPNIGDMPYFTALREDRAGGMLISPSFTSVESDTWLASAAKRIATQDGAFAGVIGAVLDLSYFSATYRSVIGNGDGTVLLMHREGKILIREPRVAGIIGKSFQDSPILGTHLPKSKSGSYEAISMIDGIPRVTGYAAVESVPLVVLVNYARAEVLAPWYQNLYIHGAVTALQLLVILIGAGVLAGRTNALVEAKKGLEVTNARFVTATSNMNQGLAVFDGDRRMVMCNERYASIYGLTYDQLRPGLAPQEVFGLRGEQGVFDGPAAEYTFRRFGDMDRPGSRIAELQDGRSILVEHNPIAGGGWVTTHEDITKRRRLERQAAEQADRLRRQEEELRIQNKRFKAALDNIGEGLSMFDAEEKLLVCNDRYGSMYDLPAELLKVGTPYRDLVAYCRKAGVSDGDSTDFAVEQRLETLRGLRRDVPISHILKLTDGRLIHIARQPLDGGGWVATHEDVTDRRRHEAKISFMAHHDLLTGLPNRTFFTEKMEDAVTGLRLHGEGFAIFMLDLDKFKNVNDRLGHTAGDQLLRETAQRLKLSLRETDVLARLGGDEFAIIQSAPENHRESATRLAARIVRAISKPYDINGNIVLVGTSIGIALAPDDADESTELLKMADLALYAAKSAGRNDFRFFQPAMLAETNNRRKLEDELRVAVQRSEFELHYQPVIDVKNRRRVGFEALVRWRNPERGLILPREFIPLAEETGLIASLGTWVLQQACADAAKWPSHLKVAVNISAVQLAQPDLFQIVLCALVEASLPPERLELEITETALFKNDTDYFALIRKLKKLGITIVLDDFGTGHSSLSYLTKFPFDKIKIDRSFTMNLTRRADCAAIVSAVLALGRSLDTGTVAEGVETEQHFEILRAAGVTFVQGRLFGDPCPISELVLDEIGGANAVESAA